MCVWETREWRGGEPNRQRISTCCPATFYTVISEMSHCHLLALSLTFFLSNTFSASDSPSFNAIAPRISLSVSEIFAWKSPSCHLVSTSASPIRVSVSSLCIENWEPPWLPSRQALPGFALFITLTTWSFIKSVFNAVAFSHALSGMLCSSLSPKVLEWPLGLPLTLSLNFPSEA